MGSPCALVGSSRSRLVRSARFAGKRWLPRHRRPVGAAATDCVAAGLRRRRHGVGCGLCSARARHARWFFQKQTRSFVPCVLRGRKRTLPHTAAAGRSRDTVGGGGAEAPPPRCRLRFACRSSCACVVVGLGATRLVQPTSSRAQTLHGTCAPRCMQRDRHWALGAGSLLP